MMASATLLPSSLRDWLCIMTELRSSGLLARESVDFARRNAAPWARLLPAVYARTL